MAKIIEYLKEQEFTRRELVLIGIVLFFAGLVLGIAVSPKGYRMIGSNNGNNNTGNFADGDDECSDIELD